VKSSPAFHSAAAVPLVGEIRGTRPDEKPLWQPYLIVNGADHDAGVTCSRSIKQSLQTPDIQTAAEQKLEDELVARSQYPLLCLVLSCDPPVGELEHRVLFVDEPPDDRQKPPFLPLSTFIRAVYRG
jgi:hypothetical protein